ncbi:MAG TPA: c-type cytochrome [Methylomirabilota bacterium]|nr:c-type cytochrome [Methylomirabilota bacterium]
MTRVTRWIATAASMLLLVMTVAPARAQQAPPPTQPFAPAWGMLAGWDVFARKGCGQCHALRGFGPVTGPDLGRITSGTSFFDVGAAMWNHLPRMGERMRAARIDRPTLTAGEVADLAAFVFTAQYYDELGNPRTGDKLFTTKACVQCHAVGGSGGAVGPPLDALKRANSPVLVAAAMWNHGPAMAEAMKAKGLTRPTLTPAEMLDVIAYVVTTAKDPAGETAQVVPGTPERGEKLFAERHCATCHAVGGKGGRVGPDLGTARQHVSLTAFAARMWNHGPAMWAKMKEHGLAVPRLSGQEMADILAYLFTAHYFDHRASAGRGGQVVRDRGCTSCHAIRGVGGKAAADFATSTVVGSPSALIAAMWNHAPRMDAKAEATGVVWPVLKGQDLADIAAYLGSLSRRPPANPK